MAVKACLGAIRLFQEIYEKLASSPYWISARSYILNSKLMPQTRRMTLTTPDACPSRRGAGRLF
jgi:hypothetical protein